MTTDGIEISALSTRCTDCRLLARKVELKRSQLSVHLASRQQTTEETVAVTTKCVQWIIIASRLFIDVEC